MSIEKIVEKLCYDYPNHTFNELEQLDSVAVIMDGVVDKPLVNISKSLLSMPYNPAVYKAIKETLEEKLSQVVS